ncbi:MAG TPA: hypothetical protein VH054_18515 [Polyangiaceae bacterium]|jgi:hypothetical protein|nr:hypothetical protein [Polyangiaceae bacterium]
MRITSPIRLPLQTGSTALTTVLLSFVCIPFLWGLVPILIAYLMARDAARARASDIVLRSDGFSVRGGAHDRFSRPWSALTPGATTVETTGELFYKRGDAPTVYQHRLVVDASEIARGASFEEVASLGAVAALIDEAVSGGAPDAAPAPNVAACPSCGAPLMPADAETVRCPYCGKDVDVPASVRAAARETNMAQHAKVEVTAQVRRALTAGSARTANALIAACGVSGYAGACGAVALLLRGRDDLMALVFIAPTVLAAMARVVIARRVAMRALAFGCAAVVAVDPEAPPTCRRCRAPLPVADDVLVTCAYCRATNVLGLNAGSAWLGDLGDLDAILTEQRRSILYSWVVAVVVTATCIGAALVAGRA